MMVIIQHLPATYKHNTLLITWTVPSSTATTNISNDVRHLQGISWGREILLNSHIFSSCLVYFNDLPYQVLVLPYFHLFSLYNVYIPRYYNTYQDPFTTTQIVSWRSSSMANHLKLLRSMQAFHKILSLVLHTFSFILMICL